MTKTVDAKVFVTTWQKGSGVTGIAKTLGITVRGACSRATSFRKKGIDLKRFSAGGGTRLDVDMLAKLAKSLGGDGKTVAAKSTKRASKKASKKRAAKKSDAKKAASPAAATA